jgi:excisionase family DNA binding protein
LDNFLTIEQAAAQLGMSVRFVRRLVAERRIAFHRYGRSVRLAEEDVAVFAAASRIEAMTRATESRRVRRAA